MWNGGGTHGDMGERAGQALLQEVDEIQMNSPLGVVELGPT